MSTKIPGVWWLFFHSKWGQNHCSKSSIFYQPCLYQFCNKSVGRLRRLKTWPSMCLGRLSHCPWSFCTFFCMLKWFALSWRSFIFKAKVSGDHQKTVTFAIYFPLTRRINRFEKSSVFYQPCLHLCCTQSVKHLIRPETWHSRCLGSWCHCCWLFCTFGLTIKCFVLILKCYYQIVVELKQRRNKWIENKRLEVKDLYIWYWLDVAK